MEDTIAALSTPIGAGGIAIIRISGPKALNVADAVFRSPLGTASAFPTHTIHLGEIVRDGQRLDQVLLSVMYAPRTYTMEDTVEINCHGGTLTARSILSHCLANGARLAEPGEFTQRAFLNGRIDLTQAEAVMDLISAKCERAQLAAINALEGTLNRHIEQLRQRLLTTLAHIEAHIDFPDEDISPVPREKLVQDISSIGRGLQQLLATAHDGKILRNGVSVAIIGRPNVGKSSLMNLLLGENRVIVSTIPGTTRDTVEEFVTIRGIPVRLIDTAGIRRSSHQIENEGVQRSHHTLHISDIRLLLIDASRRLTRQDRGLLNLCNGRKTIVLENKIDLPRRLRWPDKERPNVIPISCLTGQGIETLQQMIEDTAYEGVDHDADAEIAVNERQCDALRQAFDSLALADSQIKRLEALELVAQSLHAGLSAIGEITGSTTTEDLLDRVFSTFCIGK